VQGGLGQLLFTPHTLFAQSAPELHFRPFAHLVLQLPPQSTSVSEPFCWPSGQVGAWQIPPAHTLPAQSAPTTHFFVSAQRGHWGSGTFTPPQSLSVSVPFFTPSLQVAAWQVPYGPEAIVQPGAELHTPLTQSAPVQQFLVSTHVAPQLPPQSLAVSLASFIPLAQVLELMQIPAGQMPLAQSVPVLHFSPSAHFLPAMTHVVPPQSTSVSPPFFTPSVQSGAWHVRPGPPVALHTPLVQSVPAAHTRLVAHRGQLFDPPQSTSVSFWFFTLSGQLGA
jgi:hypothetical protein